MKGPSSEVEFFFSLFVFYPADLQSSELAAKKRKERGKSLTFGALALFFLLLLLLSATASSIRRASLQQNSQRLYGAARSSSTSQKSSLCQHFFLLKIERIDQITQKPYFFFFLLNSIFSSCFQDERGRSSRS